MKDLRQKGQTGAMGVSVGNASIVMVFAVVCLTLLAVMTLMTSNREWQTAQRSAQAVTDYYAADSLAVEIYDELRAGQAGPASQQALELVDSGETVFYRVAIDENQSIHVELTRDGAEWRVARWQVQRDVLEQIDESLDLWDGTEAGFEVWAGPVQ